METCNTIDEYVSTPLPLKNVVKVVDPHSAGRILYRSSSVTWLDATAGSMPTTALSLRVRQVWTLIVKRARVSIISTWELPACTELFRFDHLPSGDASLSPELVQLYVSSSNCACVHASPQKGLFSKIRLRFLKMRDNCRMSHMTDFDWSYYLWKSVGNPETIWNSKYLTLLILMDYSWVEVVLQAVRTPNRAGNRRFRSIGIRKNT